MNLGFEHLSRLLSSDFPVRVVAFETPGLASTGHKHIKRRDLASLAIAHRHAFVLQSSPATPSHLIAGVMRGLAVRGPVLFSLASSTASTHAGHGASMARAARLALESRAVPALLYDPSAGTSPGERLSLDGNPMPDQAWPTYDLPWIDTDGAQQVMTLPVTVADWAAAEPAYQHHFSVPADGIDPEALLRFDEYLAAAAEERAGKTPFLYVLEPDRRPGRRLVSEDIVELAEERLQVWRDLRQLAGHDLPAAVCARVSAPVLEDFERRIQELETRHRARITDLEARYPALIARRLVEGLVRAAGDGTETIGGLLRRAAAMPGVIPIPLSADSSGHGGVPASASATILLPQPTAAAVSHAGASLPATAAPVPPPAAAADTAESVTLDPYIKSELCTTCDECLNINKRMFAYNKQKQAYIKDLSAGTFRQLVMAAEKCPVSIIHPGTPLNPAEPDLAKWVAQAARFQ
jgi:pyruvate-ferredoxin/flavodoxin oxidoreductase